MNIFRLLISTIKVGIFSLLFGYANLIAIDYNNLRTEENIYIFSYIMLLSTLLLGFRLQKLNKQSVILLLLYALFWVVTLISVGSHDFLNINQVFVYLIIPTVVLLNKKVHDNYKYISLALFIGAVPLFLFIQSSNTFGLLVALSFVGLLAFASKNKTMLISLLVSPVFLYIIFLTGSRTALISFIIVVTLYFLSFAMKRKKSMQKIIINTFFTLFASIVVIMMVDEVLNLIFFKRSDTIDNLFADRTVFWEGTIQYGLSIWGNGPFYFEDSFNIGDSHNLFIEILGIVGIVPFIVYILFFIFLMYTVVVNKYIGKHITLAFFIFYFLSGMTENIFMLDNRLISFNFYFIVTFNYFMHSMSLGKNSEGDYL